MAGTYRILGKTVQSHQLAIATLLTVGVAGFALTRGDSKPAEKATASAKSTAATPAKGDDMNVEQLIAELIEENDENVN